MAPTPASQCLGLPIHKSWAASAPYSDSDNVNIKVLAALWKKGALFSLFCPLALCLPPLWNLLECAT